VATPGGKEIKANTRVGKKKKGGGAPKKKKKKFSPSLQLRRQIDPTISPWLVAIQQSISWEGSSEGTPRNREPNKVGGKRKKKKRVTTNLAAPHKLGRVKKN